MSYWKQKAKKKILEYKGTIEDNSGPNDWDYNIVAPHGMMWACSYIHCIVGNSYKGNPKWSEDLWKDVYERVSDGLIPCTFGKECEWCYPDEEE